jgi:hypothetical protein
MNTIENAAADAEPVVPHAHVGLPPDWRLSLRLSNLVGRVGSFRNELKQTHAKLTPLDDIVGHETQLSDEQLAAFGFDPCWDEVRTAIGLAYSDLQHAVSYAERAHAHIKGLLRGAAKHEYEELLARRVRANEDTLRKWEEFRETYNPPSTPFAIRQVALSALVEGCEDVARRTAEYPQEHRGSSTDFLTEIKSCGNALSKLKAKLAKLRDNPSQKMATVLEPCVAEAQAVFQRLQAVMEAAKSRSGRPY